MFGLASLTLHLQKDVSFYLSVSIDSKSQHVKNGLIVRTILDALFVPVENVTGLGYQTSAQVRHCNRRLFSPPKG